MKHRDEEIRTQKCTHSTKGYTMRHFYLSMCLYLAGTFSVKVAIAIEQDKHPSSNPIFSSEISENTRADSSSNNDINNDDRYEQYVAKRVPSGFFGMRGKKPFDGWVSSQDDEDIKRAPMGFFGLRGKKEMDYGYDKRAPSGFFGMRGKKYYDYTGLDSDETPYYEKRVPTGFMGLRGKREDFEDDLIDDIDDDKRASPENRFFGMRGKKMPSRNGFFGMRGKKYPYEFRGKFVGVRGKRLNGIGAPEYLCTNINRVRMYLFPYYCFIAVICFTYIAEATKCIASQAPEIEFYDALGCKPYIDQMLSCPTHYDCSMINKTSDNDCYLFGKIYENNEAIPDFLKTCRVNCKCIKGRVNCAQINCPAFQTRLGKDCQHIYKDNCCPEETICKKNSPFTCTYNNNTYLAGTTFDAEKCKVCTCEKDFNGKLEEPFCKRTKCDVHADESYYKALDKKCAMLYAKDKPCCPGYFSCADGTEIITRKPNAPSGGSCKFGHHQIEVGDKVVLQNPFPATCECDVPPLITCTTDVGYYKLLNKYFSDPD
ncbi:hypothetical protein MML48_8g00016394 [Holotrichia oblita]|uniref:Uncharacterized protein n=1 Tax=Holotrichia oblita TaxID=644536 RepID=A0ACB9SPP0_HOLOL|nr:hypothetical protein MML48_8g00016394 [Holotrichia oblita]